MSHPVHPKLVDLPGRDHPLPVLDGAPSPPQRQAVRRLRADAVLGPVRRIAVLRALSLGDMVCATPALRVLRQRFPRASITLVGQPWARSWAERIEDIDHFVPLPDHPLTSEVSAPEAQWQDFVEAMRAMRLDLAVQLHGNGRLSNAVVAQWGARHILAFHEPQQLVKLPAGATGTVWPQRGSEVSRLMQLLHTLGWPTEKTPDMSVSHPITEEDRMSALALLRAQGLPHGHGVGWVCVHPGSKWASRRWPLERFAAVARELAQRGHVIVLTGSQHERALAEAICQQVPHAINLCGLTHLWALGGVIDGARVLLSNDTGVSHLAAALRVPSVIVSCGSDVARWSPADGLRHRVLWSAPACRPCLSAHCTQARHICAEDLKIEQVMKAVSAALLLPSRASA